MGGGHAPLFRLGGLCRLRRGRWPDCGPAPLGRRTRPGGGAVGIAPRRARPPPSQKRREPLPRALFHDLDSLPTPRFDDYFATLAAALKHPARAAPGNLTGMLVGGGPSVHVLRPERNQPGLSRQVSRPGADRARRTPRPLPSQRLRGRRQHPRHGLLHVAAGRRWPPSAHLLRDQDAVSGGLLELVFGEFPQIDEYRFTSLTIDRVRTVLRGSDMHRTPANGLQAGHVKVPVRAPEEQFLRRHNIPLAGHVSHNSCSPGLYTTGAEEPERKGMRIARRTVYLAIVAALLGAGLAACSSASHTGTSAVPRSSPQVAAASRTVSLLRRRRHHHVRDA